MGVQDLLSAPFRQFPKFSSRHRRRWMMSRACRCESINPQHIAVKCDCGGISGIQCRGLQLHHLKPIEDKRSELEGQSFWYCLAARLLNQSRGLFGCACRKTTNPKSLRWKLKSAPCCASLFPLLSSGQGENALLRKLRAVLTEIVSSRGSTRLILRRWSCHVGGYCRSHLGDQQGFPAGLLSLRQGTSLSSGKLSIGRLTSRGSGLAFNRFTSDSLPSSIGSCPIQSRDQLCGLKSATEESKACFCTTYFIYKDLPGIIKIRLAPI